jgi:toxin ParE1/3/4
VSKPIIERRPRVDLDLYEIAAYIAADNSTAAMAFLDAAEKTFTDLATTPGLGRLRKFKTPRLTNIRSWRVRGFENYLIFYESLSQESSPGISVVRVLHGARDLESIFEEE